MRPPEPNDPMAPFASPGGDILPRGAVPPEQTSETTLLAAERMEALGALAGSIAHDFNNVLFGIGGYAELLRLDVPAESAAGRNLSQLTRAADRARDLVAQVQTFARLGDVERVDVPLDDLVARTLDMARSQANASTTVVSQIQPGLEVRADPALLARAVLNVLTNATQAMPHGGRLLVTLSAIDVDRRRHPGLALLPGRYAEIVVADSGLGIPPGMRPRIFEPFFTTRQVGGGLGLGLSVAHGVTAALSGAIVVQSTPRDGCAFRILLPLEPLPAPAPGTYSGQCVLLVDDDPTALRSGREGLELLGLDVMARNDSRAVLAEALAGDLHFDVAIVDHAMPGIAGPELAQRLLEAHDAVPIVLASGLPTGGILAPDAVTAVVTKPFLPHEVAAVVARALRCAGSQR